MPSWRPRPIRRTARDRARPAGDAVTVGEIGLAGWYIPAGNGAGPTAPTVVIAHGWGSNKSNMLDRAAVVHDAYNLLLLDLRNHGQSADAPRPRRACARPATCGR